MAMPKRRKSKSKVRMCKRAHKIALPNPKPCPNCGDTHLPHRVCPACGYYRGRQVLSINAE